MYKGGTSRVVEMSTGQELVSRPLAGDLERGEVPSRRNQSTQVNTTSCY